nr:MAG TPA: hypothetical protein [Caudoviricetes sp.]
MGLGFEPQRNHKPCKKRILETKSSFAFRMSHLWPN